MTNGEKIQTILDVDRDCTEVHGENGTMTFTVTQDFWNAEYKEPTTVSLNVYKQVAKERDIAIQQLHELGYDFGQKIEPTTKNNCAEQNGCITCSLDDGDDCCRKLYEESMQEPTTKNDLGVDCISRAEARKAIIDHQYSDSFCEEHNIDHSINTGMALIALSDLPSVTPQEPRWIPLTKRPMTDEETEYYFEYTDMRIDDTYTILDCPLPDDGQEVLVSYGGYVCVDTFCKDDGCYFEGVDIDDVDAWMPLPKSYNEVKK